jgi:AraC-like DNA-binding protein
MGAPIDETVDEMVIARPRGPLAKVVSEHHAYRQRGLAPARHIGLPSAALTLIVTVDEPLVIAEHVNPEQAPGEYNALIGGLHTRPALITHDGAQSGIQLTLSPLGTRAMFGVPAGELAALDLDLGELLGPLATELHERVRHVDTWQARFAVLDRALGARLNLDDRPPPEVCRAWHRLRSTQGRIGIASLAREVGWSERHLASRFRTEIGLTPKAAARVIRFHRARRLIGHRPGADVAAECGYFDQAHLVRDFVAFSGLTPTAWLAAERPSPEVANFQAVAAAGERPLAS